MHVTCFFPPCVCVCMRERERERERILSHINKNLRKDKKMYIACYKDLAEKLPGPPTALLLGDAYMNIQEVKFNHE